MRDGNLIITLKPSFRLCIGFPFGVGSTFDIVKTSLLFFVSSMCVTVVNPKMNMFW